MPNIFIKDWPPFSPPDEERRKCALEAAKLMVNAALTAPVAGGHPQTESNIVYGLEELEEIARKLEELAYLGEEESWEYMFKYEAVMVRESDAVVFLGNYRCGEMPFDLPGCGLCGGRTDCSFLYERKKTRSGLIDITDRRSDRFINGPLCSLKVKDFGFAVGSALWMATRLFVDARPFMSVGLAGQKLGYCRNSAIVVGIPVATQSKNPYVDINPDYHLVNMSKMIDTVRQTYIIGPRQIGVDYRKWDPAREFIYAPCEHECPIHMDAVGYVALTAQGRFEEALSLVRRRTPLPSVLGRVCHHPCENVCKREEHDEKIAIFAVKRFLTDYGIKNRIPVEILTEEPKQEKVAIVGSGPAGLTAAFYLAKKGYKVTIFEALPVIGGMLAVGIPDYRLPKDVLDFDLAFINKLGIETKTSTMAGKDMSINDLFNQGFKAIFLAVGAHKGKELGIPGEDLEGVIDGVEFLRKIKLGENIAFGEKIIVVGGGNVAIDVARSLIRLGIKENKKVDVTLVCLESRPEMPGFEEEIEGALIEGVKIDTRWGPKSILGKDGKVVGLEVMAVKSVFDKNGMFNPAFDTYCEKVYAADTVILAIGQMPDLSFFSEENWLSLTKQKNIIVDPVTLSTNKKGVFAGGEAVTGLGRVVDAIGDGERAALFIDKYIQGKPMAEEVRYPEQREEITRSEEIPKGTKREVLPKLPVGKRLEKRNIFKEVDLCFSEGSALKEAKRCVRCDLERGTSKLLFEKSEQ